MTLPKLATTVLVALLIASLSTQGAGATADALGARRLAADTAAVPHGWLPFSFGYIQMAVWPDWNVYYNESAPFSCLPGCLAPVTLIYTGPSPNNPAKPDCAGGPSDTTVLVWYPSSLRGATALKHETINGIALDGPRVAGRWQELSIPKLRYVIYVTGPKASAVLHTLTYSPRAALARLEPAPAVPAGWRWLDADGLRFAVPSNWPVGHLAARGPQFATGGPLWEEPSRVVIYSGGQPCLVGWGFASEGGTASGLGPALSDQEGVVLSSPPLRFSGTEFITGPTPSPCASIHTLRICLSPGDNTLFGPALYTIKRLGDRSGVTLTVGLAGDGLAARTIIGSFRPA